MSERFRLAKLDPRARRRDADASVEPAEKDVPLVAPPAPTPDPFALAERRVRRAERSEREQAERASAAERELETQREQIAALERRLADAERDRAAAQANLSADLGDHERLLREARQQAHAEQALREELLRRTSDQSRRTAAEADSQRLRAQSLAAQAERLERELEAIRRSEAEAHQAAAAAESSRHRLRRELTDALAHLDSLEQRSAALERELSHLRGRLHDEELRHAALEQRREELDADRERHAAALRLLDRVAGAASTPPAAGVSFRERLAADRDARRVGPPAAADSPDPAEPPGPAQPAGPAWLPAALRRLARRDPESAIRLALSLLPAQARLAPDGLDCDLRAADAGWYRLTGDGAVHALAGRRGGREADFRVLTEVESLVELLIRGGRGRPGARPRLRGALRARRARSALPPVPPRLDELAALGARVEPALAFRALATLIEPAWTAGHSFCVSHEVAADGERPIGYYVTVRDGRPVVVAERPPEVVDATVRSTAQAWTALLSGRPAPAGQRPAVRGDAGAVALLHGWTRRAQGLD